MAKRKLVEGRLITRHHFPKKKYHMFKEPAYWTALVLLIFAGFVLITFSNIRPPSDIVAAPQLNTLFGIKIATLFIVFVIAAAILLIVLIAKRLSHHALESEKLTKSI